MIRPCTLLVLVCTSFSLSPALADDAWPAREWQTATPAEVGLDAAQLERAKDYALTGDGAGYITRHGKLVLTWGNVGQRFDLKSSTKSIGVTALGLALGDERISLDDHAADLHPTLGVPPESNRETGWIDDITIRHLATQTSGFEKPGGYGKILFEPGTMWLYSDAGPNWLAECLTLIYRRDMDELLFERVFTPIGITRDDLRWRRNSYRDHEIDGIMRREFGSGISANVDAMARIGLLYLREGRWKDEQILPREFVAACGTAAEEIHGLPEHPANSMNDNASEHYGLLWWNNADGTIADLPTDAFWSWGLYDSLTVVIPSLDMVVSRAGRSWKREEGAEHYEVLKPFLDPIARAVRDDRSTTAASFSRDPEGSVLNVVSTSNQRADARRSPARIAGLEWAPVDTIRRAARGSDNWPVTWGDDDALYTAYGDGWGFEPRVDRKLSLGLACVTGGPEDFAGNNLRAPTGELLGDGVRGGKASGILMVDGVLYMLVRNTGNAQLAWSRDRGRSWAWADWKFTTSFGCPTFVNYGRNYEGARDELVYVISFDSDSAYEAADRLVLARVPAGRIAERDAYEYFERRGVDDAVWNSDVGQRGGILERPSRCYRCGISYNAPLGRYLLAMLPGGDTRTAGGIAIYESPEPWGPWSSIFETDQWDVGPGESASFPTKWISDDGRTVHLVFSGNDSFSVRRATLLTDD